MSSKDLSTQFDNKQVAKNPENDNIDFYLSDIWRGVKKFWWLCALLVFLFTAAMALLSYVRFVPTYTVSATFTVQTQDISASGAGITSYSYYYNRTTAEQLSSTFPYILESKLLQSAVCEDLGVESMPASISATSVTGTNMFTMKATGRDAQATYDVLLSAMKNYPSVAEYVIGSSELTMISEPVLPENPSNSRQTLKYMMIGAVLGIVLSGAWILIYAVFRNTVRTNRDIKEKLNQSCLGVLPVVSFKKYKSEIDRSVLMVNSLTGDTFLETVRKLRNKVVNEAGENTKAIMVTSSAPAEGKSTVSVNLAIALAKMGKKVMLVDGDLHHPSINEILSGFEGRDFPCNDPQITLKYIDDLDIGVLTFNVDEKDIWKVMQTQYLKKCFDELREECDYIIVDAPPCALSSDPVTIAGAVDAALLVIKQDTVRITRIKYAIDSLQSVDAKILGCVLNAASSGISGYGYYHGGYGYKYSRYGYSKYGYGYGYNKEK